jgi:plasmid stabilization system protein ParE
MTYRVVMHQMAEADLAEAYRRVARHAPNTALRWLDRFQTALLSLDQRPERCPRAPEARKVKVDLHEFLFGRRPNVFRVVFVIDGDTVRILRIRRGQRRLLTRSQIEDALGP